MMRRWAILLILGWSAISGRPVLAETPHLLYRIDQTNLARHQRVGQVLHGAENIGRLTSPTQRWLLTPTEQRTVQQEVHYHSLFVPNDPQFTLQWNLNAIQVPTAWDVDQTAPSYGGDPKIVVAVLDTGLASTIVGAAQSVPDLADTTIWTNTKEIAGDGLDNDGDGLIDDIHGWNFVANTAAPVDVNGHGTHISTTIAGAMNNSIATAGIAANVKIMPLKVLDNNGDGSTSTLTAAVNFAVAHGANVINLSLGGDQDDPIFHQALIAAIQQGVVIVGAAGNSGAGAVSYPARYPEVISVGATQYDSTRASYSDYGPTLDLVAPGGNNEVDQNGDGQPDGIPSQTCVSAGCPSFATMFYAGTSQAAAHVSGVVALMESCGAAPGTVRTILASTARDLGATGRDDQFGAGLVNATAALNAAGCRETNPDVPSGITATASVSVAAPVFNQRPASFTKPVFHWTGPVGATFLLTWSQGNTVLTQQKQTVTSFSPSISTEATYVLSVRTVDALGRASSAQTFTYRYRKPVVIASSGTTIRLLSSTLATQRTLKPRFTGTAMTLAGGPLPTDQSNRILVAAQSGGPDVTIFDTQGKRLSTLQPFGKKFTGVITTAILHLADGTSRFVAATNTNGASLVWFSASGKVLGRNQLYPKYSKGLEITTGDITGDGNDELMVAQSAGPEIRIYSADRQRLRTLAPRGKTFTQGWTISAGDANGDGIAEIIATPHVKTKSAKVLVLSSTGGELSSWKVGGLSGQSRLLLQAIDLDANGLTEVVTTQQTGNGAILVWSTQGKLLRRGSTNAASTNALGKM